MYFTYISNRKKKREKNGTRVQTHRFAIEKKRTEGEPSIHDVRRNVMLSTKFYNTNIRTKTLNRMIRRVSVSLSLSQNEYKMNERVKKLEKYLSHWKVWWWFQHRSRPVHVFLFIWHISILISWPLKQGVEVVVCMCAYMRTESSLFGLKRKYYIFSLSIMTKSAIVLNLK